MFKRRPTMSIRLLFTLAVVICTNLLTGLSVRGADEPKKPAVKPTGEPKSLREFIDDSMGWYEVFPNADAREPAKVLPTLRWANNVRGSDDGVTVLFVQDGMPLAAACIFPWRKRIYHCFESLSREKVVARRDGKAVWEPQEPGVAFSNVINAPVPSETVTVRLRQMKALAERFGAIMTVKKADTTEREELRLLPTPLFRYDPKSGDVIDGAVFAFVVGTDPEVLLQLEAVKINGKTTWQYAFARRTYCRLECSLDKKVVWEVEQYPGQDDPKKPHYTASIPLPP